MSQVEFYIKRAKRRVDYMRVDFLQKYYSNTHDPKIIQSKLSDNITSLRTCPLHPYTQPEIFLKLSNSDEEEISKQHKQLVLQYEQGLEGLQQMSLDENLPLLEVNSCAPSDSQPDNSDNPQTENFTKPLEKGDDKNSCDCLCHKQQSEPPTSPILDVEEKKKKRSWFEFAALTRPRFGEIPFFPHLQSSPKEYSPIQLIDRDFSNQEESSKEINSPDLQIPSDVFKHELIKSYSSENLKRPHSVLFRTPSVIPSAPVGPLSSLGSLKKSFAWKKVYSNISLSAARVSAGGTPISREQLPKITSDFTDILKLESQDLETYHGTQELEDYYDLLSIYDGYNEEE